MQRRKLLKQIGASSAIAVGATGFATAQGAKEIPLSEAEYITAEVDGEMREFTLEEFDQHPDTKSLSEVEPECCYECKECCQACCSSGCCFAKECGSCSGC